MKILTYLFTSTNLLPWSSRDIASELIKWIWFQTWCRTAGVTPSTSILHPTLTIPIKNDVWRSTKASLVPSIGLHSVGVMKSLQYLPSWLPTALLPVTSITHILFAYLNISCISYHPNSCHTHWASNHFPHHNNKGTYYATHTYPSECYQLTSFGDTYWRVNLAVQFLMAHQLSSSSFNFSPGV